MSRTSPRRGGRPANRSSSGSGGGSSDRAGGSGRKPKSGGRGRSGSSDGSDYRGGKSKSGSGSGPKRGRGSGAGRSDDRQQRTHRDDRPGRDSGNPRERTDERDTVDRRDERDSRGFDGGRGGGGRGSKPRGLGGDQVEGRQAIREMLIAGKRSVSEILMASDLDPAPILEEIVELAHEDRVVVRQIGRSKLESIARTSAPQGIIARAEPLADVSLDSLITGVGLKANQLPFLLALDGITDPGNLGTLLRTAEGAGVTGVIIPKHRAAHITPAVAKAAAGAIEYLPLCQVGGLASAMMDLTRAGVWSLGLDGGDDTSLFDVKIPDVPVVVVLGAEGSGLSRLVGERCDQLAAIPRGGQLESLNVAAAGAVACYEVARSRLK